MPYIALQLVGIQVVLQVMGIGGGEDASLLEKDLPLFIAFAILAAYTYTSGLRAPALIAFVKDTLIYIVILVAVIYLPIHLGGWDGIFDAANAKVAGRQRGARCAHPGGRPRRDRLLGLRHAGARIGVRAVHVPALGDGRALDPKPQCDPAQRVAAAGVLVPAGPARPARVRRDRRRRRCRRREPGDPAAVRERVPQLVRRGRVRGDRRSVRWSRRRSCRSRPPTCGPATSTRPS